MADFTNEVNIKIFCKAQKQMNKKKKKKKTDEKVGKMCCYYVRYFQFLMTKLHISNSFRKFIHKVEECK